MYRPNLQSVALPTPEIIAIAGLGWGCEPQSRGKGSRMGSGMVPFERALVSSYRASIVTFHLSLCVSEILLLLCSTTPLATAWDLISVRSELVLLDNGCVLFSNLDQSRFEKERSFDVAETSEAATDSQRTFMDDLLFIA